MGTDLYKEMGMDELKIVDRRRTVSIPNVKPEDQKTEPEWFGWTIQLHLRSEAIIRVFIEGQEDMVLVTSVLSQRIKDGKVAPVTILDTQTGVRAKLHVNYAAVDYFHPPVKVFK